MPGALSSSSFPSPCSLFRPQVKYHFLWETSPDPLRLHAKLLLCGPFASRPPTPVVYVHHIVIITYNRLYLLNIRFSVYAWPKCLTNTYLMKGNMFVELMKRCQVESINIIFHCIPFKQTPRQGIKCKGFLWEMIPKRRGGRETNGGYLYGWILTVGKLSYWGPSEWLRLTQLSCVPLTVKRWISWSIYLAAFAPHYCGLLLRA